MEKIFVIYEEDGYMYDTSSKKIGFVADEDSAKDYITRRNEPYNLEKKDYDNCKKCRRYADHDMYDEIKLFRLSDTCENSAMKTDRNGKYCENDKSCIGAFNNPYYWYESVDKIGNKRGDIIC